MKDTEKKYQAGNEALLLLEQGHLESAYALLHQHRIAVDLQALAGLIADCARQAAVAKEKGEIRSATMLRRRVESLTMFRDQGVITEKCISFCMLAEGYRGKILIVSVKGNWIEARTCLRSGDDWHIEILKSFEEEVYDYGFENFQIIPRGGAFAAFRQDGSIVLSGSSEAFGPCPMETAAGLIRTTYPGRRVYCSDIGR